MRAKKRIRSRKGFTLAETLLAVLILLLVSSIVAAGMPAVKQAYEKVVLASNAELMLSTAVATLRDELGTAWDVQEVADGVTYFSADTTNRSKLYVESGTIKLYEYSETTAAEDLLGITKKASAERELVYHAKDDTALKLVCESIVPGTGENKNTVVVSGLCVKNKDNVVAQWGGKTAADLVIPVFSTRDED
ncbi:MAG: prepilin-type N-terminal cleavage/methylation domain-containing protein [Clostridia bacterium]|nr:prepilin-type N-terminal cleavage/methylation domain-containing protein [Clostridia bacterium]